MSALIDVNVLVAAHRPDHPAHQRCRDCLDGPCRDGFALTAHVWNGFIRLVTHDQVFAKPTPMDVALAAVDTWRRRPRSEVLSDSAASWEAFSRLCRQQRASGNAVYDLHLAALAIADDRLLISSDAGFGAIPGLRWQQP
jgi:toxin-antitoxin system PIN domain toxin